MASENKRQSSSIFDLPPRFFDSCRLLSSGPEKPQPLLSSSASKFTKPPPEQLDASSLNRLSCNTCAAEFESLLDQRSHFKSDFHRLNVKLTLAGKSTVKEEDFDDFTSNSSPRDFDVSSISGSEDEDDRPPHAFAFSQNLKQKLFFSLPSGERVSMWKCFVLRDSETVLYDIDAHQSDLLNKEGRDSYLAEVDVVQRLHRLLSVPKDKFFTVVLLASGGHFAGCVFQATKVVTHKTFHRYVVRAKAGKKQSSKDGGGRSIHSAGASLRRYNELALKKDIQDLLASWKSYFDSASRVLIHAPSDNKQLFFKGDKAVFGNDLTDVRNIPSTVRRPTFKEAQRIYNQLSQVTYEVDEKETSYEEILALETANVIINDGKGYTNKVDIVTTSISVESTSSSKIPHEQTVSSESETEVIGTTTPLHEAAKVGDAIQVLELLEEGLDPTTKDERGKTPYMLADEKEVRNSFRRFMAANLDKWDWNAAKVPSALTKEMEESQAAKQAEKDAKKKAKAKELKKLRKAKEKKAQAEAASAPSSKNNSKVPLPVPGVRPQPAAAAPVSKMEEVRRKLAEEREKRAAAAERRMAAAAVTAASTSQGPSSATAVPTSQATHGPANDMSCSCCKSSLLGKVPFHRFSYKYCSSTCMHVHRESLEDG